MTRPDRSCPAPHKAKEASCNFGCCLFTISQWNCISRLKMQIITGTCFLFLRRDGSTKHAAAFVVDEMEVQALCFWELALLDVQSPHQALEAAFRSAHRTRYRTAARGHM